jgi:transcriptional regulator with XRE-family HTH domain
MDVVRIGLSIRALRHRLGWRQDDLARRANVSQSAVSRAERGRLAGLSLGAVDRLVTSVGGHLDVRVLYQGERLDRLLDAAHAAAVERVVRMLIADGWEAVAEVSFAIYGERGSIDVFARHLASGRLLVVEVKTVVPDVQAMLLALDRKVRLAVRIAAERGWAPAPVSALLVVVDSSTARRRVGEHAGTLESKLPVRGRAVRRWLGDPASTERPMAGLWFLPPMRHPTVRKRIRIRNGPPDPLRPATSHDATARRGVAR